MLFGQLDICVSFNISLSNWLSCILCFSPHAFIWKFNFWIAQQALCSRSTSRWLALLKTTYKGIFQLVSWKLFYKPKSVSSKHMDQSFLVGLTTFFQNSLDIHIINLSLSACLGMINSNNSMLYSIYYNKWF